MTRPVVFAALHEVDETRTNQRWLSLLGWLSPFSDNFSGDKYANEYTFDFPLIEPVACFQKRCTLL